jgi:hypothetical protein
LYLLPLIHTSTYQKKKKLLPQNPNLTLLWSYHKAEPYQKSYVESLDLLSYLGLKFQVNQSLGRHPNTGQHRLYKFYYLLPFDSWTSYLARIIFLQGCGSCFWEFPCLARIFNGQQHSFHVLYELHINVEESLRCMKTIILSL